MNYLALFFIAAKMYAFMYTKELAYFIQSFSLMLQNRKKNPKIRQVLVVDKNSLLFILYFIVDILFMFYCIWIMLGDTNWEPGCMLLMISALESYAMHSRISGTYTIHRLGFIYPKPWLRYLTTGMTLFILLNLLQNA